MATAVFHHLDGYKCFQGTSNYDYLIMPFQKPSFEGSNSDEETNNYQSLPIYKKCKNNIVFLVLALMKEPSESEKLRYIQFPYEFSSLILPKSKEKNCYFQNVGPIMFVPGNRNNLIFLCVLNSELYLFVVKTLSIDLTEIKGTERKPFATPDSTSTYFQDIIEVKNEGKFDKIIAEAQPFKKYSSIDKNQYIRKIIFMPDGRHFLVICKNRVYTCHIEDDTKAQLTINFRSIEILNSDYRNDILLLLVQKVGEKEQEVMFFDLQSRPTYNINFNPDKTDVPSYSICITNSLISFNPPIFYPRLKLAYSDKGIYANELNEFNGIHNVQNPEDFKSLSICGCKFLPGDNESLAIVIYDEKDMHKHVYFFKLKHVDTKVHQNLKGKTVAASEKAGDTWIEKRVVREIKAFDIYQVSSIEHINAELEFLEGFVFGMEKEWFDIVGNDKEFEFALMLFSHILIRFHYFFDPNGTSQRSVPSVQVINTYSYKEDFRAIIYNDQQLDDTITFEYLPAALKDKSSQMKFFAKQEKLDFEWLKILGPKPTLMPCIIQIEYQNNSPKNTGFRNFATYEWPSSSETSQNII